MFLEIQAILSNPTRMVLAAGDRFIVSLLIIRRALRPTDLDQLHVPRVRTSVGTLGTWNQLPLEIRSAKIRFQMKSKAYFLVRLFRLGSSVVMLAQTTNANGFGTMSQITIMFVAPLISDHR